MTEPVIAEFNPETDLIIERELDVPPALVWAAWTQPEHLMQWFTPEPWRTVHCEIDLRPGGRFRTTMRSPEGEEFDQAYCFLSIEEGLRLAWTEALLPGFRPGTSRPDLPALTAVITIEPSGAGTRYRAMALHADVAGRDQHAAMGFYDGWGTVADQMVAAIKRGFAR